MSDEPSTRVEEPIKRELSWFKQGLSDAVDHWRDEARSWRRLVFPVFVLGLVVGGVAGAVLEWVALHG